MTRDDKIIICLFIPALPVAALAALRSDWHTLGVLAAGGLAGGCSGWLVVPFRAWRQRRFNRIARRTMGDR